MNGTEALWTVDHWLAVPHTALGLFRRVTGSALANARHSLDDITAAVTDRTTLREDLGGAAGTGDLTRLSRRDCLELLAGKRFGRLAYLARAHSPDIVPVNYVLDGSDILIATGPGPKLQSAERREVVALQVDEIDEQEHSGWSVLVVGRAERLSPADEARLSITPPWAKGPRHHLMRITPRRVEGRRLL